MLQLIVNRLNRSSPRTEKDLLVKYKRLQDKKCRNDNLGKVNIRLEHDIYEIESELSRLKNLEAIEAAEIAEIVTELERESIL